MTVLRPTTVRAALWIQIAVLVAGIILTFLDFPTSENSLSGSAAVQMMIVVLFVSPRAAVTLIVTIYAYHGRNWARWVLAVLCAISVLVYLKSLSQVVTSGQYRVVWDTLDLLVVGGQVAAVALFFSVNSSAWFASSAKLERAS